MKRPRRYKWVAAAMMGLLFAPAQRAHACGCFAPPSPMTPVVQAGERILFSHDGNNVTAYIQIQYQGAAPDFGWLVPLPSVPTLELGTDELFTALQGVTNPQYSITTTREFCGGGSSSSSSGVGCGSPFGAGDESATASSDLGVFAASDMGSSNPIVVAQSSIGPYDYAVLHADDQSEMLQWLDDNRYYVPDATGQAVAPYIHPGAYFLALRLSAGESAGDVVPIVLKYASDLPMIPITLTSVGAIPNMGILVWNLGQARAIPRNYYHVELDEMPIWADLLGYPQHVISAVKSAPNHHAFITEYAGSSSVMYQQLNYPGRFGDVTYLRLVKDPVAYVDYLASHGYPFGTTLDTLLEHYIPEPPLLINQGVTLSQFYQDIDLYRSDLEPADPDAGVPSFDPASLTDDIMTRIITPTQDAQALFDQIPYLTRLYTALSPEDMNLDPVFSENPDLPKVASQHTATLTVPCVGNAWLATEKGREEQWISSLPPNKSYPAAEKIETLREAGDPNVITDNTATIQSLLGPVDHGSATLPSSSSPSHDSGCDCDIHRRVPNGALWTFLMVAGAIFIARRRWVG